MALEQYRLGEPVDIDWDRLRDIGYSAYFQGEAAYRRFRYRRHHQREREAENMNAPNHVINRDQGAAVKGRVAPFIYGDAGMYRCGTVYGKKKSKRMNKVIEAMMIRELLVAQSLNSVGANPGAWRNSGTYIMRYQQEAVNANYTQIISFPVYVFRMSAPCGYTEQPNTNGNMVNAFPHLAYRLTGYQSIGVDLTWVYRWEPVGMFNNAGGNANASWSILESKSNSFLQAPEIYQEYFKSELLITAASQNNCQLCVDIIRFNDNESAPPDQYYVDNAGSLVTFASNSGIGLATPATSVNPTFEQDTNNARYYTNWLANTRTHPLNHGHLGSESVKKPPPFTRLRKFCRILGARSTMNANPSVAQLLHTTTDNVNRWIKTASHNKAQGEIKGMADPAGFYPNTLSTYNKLHASGVFPDPKKQRWLLVTGFNTNTNYLFSTGLDPLNEASFDIRLQAAFAAPSISGFNTVGPI